MDEETTETKIPRITSDRSTNNEISVIEDVYIVLEIVCNQREDIDFGVFESKLDSSSNDDFRRVLLSK